MKPDFQRIQSLLREAVTMLCKNSLPYKSELCVEGLLGITLDREDIFLVNIKEILKSHEFITSVDDINDSKLVIGERSLSPVNSQEEPDNEDSSADCSTVSTRAVVPIFKPPNKVQRSHKRAVSNSSELSRHWFASVDQQASGDSRLSEWEEGVHTPPHTTPPTQHPPHNKRRRLESSHQFNSHETAIDVDSLSVMEVKKEALDENVPSASMTNYRLQHTGDNLSNLNELTNFAAVHMSQGETEAKHILPVSLPSIAGLTSSSWHMGAGDILSTSMPSLPNLSSDMVSAGLPSSHFNNSVNVGCHQDAASPGSDVPLDPDLLNKIQSAVLKDEGCFITSRMLCRRYSALFKVHHVVQAMQAMVLPPDDERHIGVFKFINERTKVFYKCPPCAIKPAALAAFGVTPGQYRRNFYRLPRNKSMKADNWAVFVEHILRCNPYGPVNMPDFLSVGSPGMGSPAAPPVQEPEVARTPATQTVLQATMSTTMAGSQKGELLDTYDEFDIQCAVVQTDGCFASSRCLCRKNTYRVLNVIRAMTAMSRPRLHPLYIGTYVRVSERVKVFYKCPPHLVSAEALRLYGVDAASYTHFYRRNPRPPERAMLNWTGYVEAIVRKWPFNVAFVPFDSFQLPDVDVFRLRSVVGIDARPIEDPPLGATAFCNSETGKFADTEMSFDATDTTAETLSLDTADVSPLSLGYDPETVAGSDRTSPPGSDAGAADRTSPPSQQATDDSGDRNSGAGPQEQRMEEGGEISQLHC